MTLKAGATVTIVQILPDNQVLISRGDTTNTFKVSKESLTPESLAVATPTIAPTPVVAATINSSLPYLSKTNEVIDFLKTEGINTNIVKVINATINPIANITVTTIGTTALPSETGKIQNITYTASKKFETTYFLYMGSHGFGTGSNRITPDSLATAKEEIKKNIDKIEIYLKETPDLQVALTNGATTTIDEICLEKNNGTIKKRYLLKSIGNTHYNDSDCTPNSLAKAISAITAKNN